MLFPFSIESAMSLIPSKNTIPTTITHDRYPALDTGFGSVDEIVNPILSGSMEAHPEYSANPMHIWITALGWGWLAVMLCMLLYMAASFIYLRIKTRVKVEREDNVYLCDYVKTPFILGIIRQRIYLPSDISDKDYSLVVAHERAHIKRLDHIWKPLGFLILSIYWFNPLLCIESVLDFAAEGKNGQISLPHKLCACFEDGILTFRPECEADIETEAYSVSLPFGLTFIEGTCFAVSVSTSSDVTYPEGYMLYDTACVSAELSLSARNRREGDRIFTGGMHKRIKKLMCDKKVPSCDRSSLPLIFAGDELIFAPKCAISDIAKQKKQKQITISIFRKYI